jgi:hypothetical protein
MTTKNCNLRTMETGDYFKNGARPAKPLEQEKKVINDMYKYLKSLEQYANLSNRGAMETGDHFKNGASPKSLTSRGNFKTEAL